MDRIGVTAIENAFRKFVHNDESKSIYVVNSYPNYTQIDTKLG